MESSMMKYVKQYEGEMPDGDFSTSYKWKHWTFEITKKGKDKTFTIFFPECFESYFKSDTGYRKLEKAEKAIDIAILHFVRYIKAKEVKE